MTQLADVAIVQLGATQAIKATQFPSQQSTAAKFKFVSQAWNRQRLELIDTGLGNAAS